MASGMQEKQYTASLLSFFVYNPTFGPREGEVSSTLGSLLGPKFYASSTVQHFDTAPISLKQSVHFFFSGGEEDFVLPPQ